MEVICSRKVLHKGLQSVGRAVSGRSTLPILSNVLLSASEKGLGLLGTDLEVWMESVLPVEVKEKGAVTVPARLLSEVVSALPEATVQLRADDRGAVSLLCGTSNYEIVGLPAEEFPALPEVGKDSSFEIKQELLGDLIRKTVFAASTDETRAILTGTLLLWEGKRIRMVATDSYRLSTKAAELEDTTEKDLNVIIPARALHELSRFLDRGKEEQKVEVRIGPSQILFGMSGGEEDPGEFRLVSRLVEGQFPKFDKFLSHEYERRLSVHREDFLSAIKRCLIIARAEASRLLLEPSGDKMKVSAESADYGKAEEELPVSLEGEGIQIAFNGEYFRDALEAMSAEMVWLELGSPLSHGLLKPNDDPEHICIFMPMRIF
ncbi:MAG: DNA polymerase III subunit beta [Armatimonadetes bacterium]|nr:DNA polymerase III subunit beta [Armatimonadota bacterium]NIM23215.1 DNA polymerase III subunit beta [Armatimonadota bacterium]NIM67083.1 DNA polymerase III subunit beta [Armatimonadota bacterium]NIM75610.1 DNA polymerase III subunit beta [Armatimonadota bacterium]NIN05272.1 DNA polymerase III subunit beta [Armatimonadota bacterium]